MTEADVLSIEGIASAIGNIDSAQALSGVTDLWNRVRSTNMGVDQCRLLAKLIITKIDNRLVERRISIKSIFFNDDQRYVIDHLPDCASLEAHVRDLLKSVTDYLSSYRRDNLSSLMISAIQITENSYSDPDFSLTELARRLNVSTNYLSTKFKAETGTNFVRFLNSLRIGKAMELLYRREYRIYEIASFVGISDVGYFTKVFREYYGETPNGYRNHFIDKQW